MVTPTQTRIDVETLKRAHPILEVVARYGIELCAAGHALKGRCPFHADGGRPNLYVYPNSQSWYCFRCGLGGDAIAFVMRREGLSFLEACARLATGDPLPRRLFPLVPTGPAQEPGRRWDRLALAEQRLMNRVCACYQDSLWRTPHALAYLRRREIPEWLIRTQAIGYASGRLLGDCLNGPFEVRLAKSLGLLREDGRDFFAGRVIVPELRNRNCIWFIGRCLNEAPDRPKYLALPGERPVLGFARAVGRREAFLCEGVFDYLSAVTWKLPAFSPCGTHLPAGQLGFLARAEAVYGVLDGDPAGKAAAEGFATQIGPRWQPLTLPEGYDLNDLACQLHGRAAFFALLASARQEHRRARYEEG